jgi:hypothetical protein
MNVRKIALGAIAAISLAAASGAHAAAFTDEAAWRAAVGNIYALETWDTGATPVFSDVGAVANLGI